jgi:hypothetical protein
VGEPVRVLELRACMRVHEDQIEQEGDVSQDQLGNPKRKV